MAQEIVDVSGQTGNQILQTLNKRGIQTSLLNLVQSTGAESARNIPRFIVVEDGQVKGGSDTQPQTQTQPQPQQNTKSQDWAISNPDIAYLFREDPEVGVGRTGTYLNVPMQEQPIGPDTVPGPDLEYAQQRLAQVQSNAEKPDYSYSQLAKDIGGTVKEKVLDPVMSGVRSFKSKCSSKRSSHTELHPTWRG